MQIELLAPAKNKAIGIAAINCGADALYIAGPSFGARESAGNSVEDIAELVEYGHRFGVRIYMVVNTILYEHELEDAKRLIWDAYRIGCDAIIIQDLGILEMDLPPVRLHASTQTNIRSVERAVWLDSLGFDRLILARELSIEQIAEIGRNVKAETEAFIHGALCVSYSGQCYMSACLTGRSANRGSCIQACRSRYDLLDENGNVLVKDTPLLSLKDFMAGKHITDMIKAGVTSFKIEGRLKNASYVCNTVRYYSMILDRFISENPEYSRSSFGKVHGGFEPDPYKTFSRGFTDFNLDGKRGNWLSGSAANAVGEKIGKTSSESRKTKYETTVSLQSCIRGKWPLAPGDGICIVTPDGKQTGAGINRVENSSVTFNGSFSIPKGSTVYRNYSTLFEKGLERNMPERTIDATVTVKRSDDDILFEATIDGREERYIVPLSKTGHEVQPADNPERARTTAMRQLCKKASVYDFRSCIIETEMPFLPISALNAIRRNLAEGLDAVTASEMKEKSKAGKRNSGYGRKAYFKGQKLTYLHNISNSLSRKLHIENGADSTEDAYELSMPAGAELMRTKYCLRYQMGMCFREASEKGIEAYSGNLYLRNNGRIFLLGFDCGKCEMTVRLSQ